MCEATLSFYTTSFFQFGISRQLHVSAQPLTPIRKSRESELKRIKFHGLHHTHVSLLIENGADLRVVSERVGHTSAAFTQEIYQHLYDDQRGLAALGLTNMLEPKERISN